MFQGSINYATLVRPLSFYKLVRLKYKIDDENSRKTLLKNMLLSLTLVSVATGFYILNLSEKRTEGV
jgi:hypothetical protein